jgi:NAD-dependent SIR2 family protein deacetylase
VFKNATEYLNSHGLAFDAQPELGELFALLADPGVHVTFVVGAGFSMNAGLPSWDGLLANMARKLDKPSIELALLDPDPVTRRAEYLIRMLQKGGSPADEGTIVRDALYPKSPVPGPLHEALAQLLEALGDRARVVTTNFDPLLEQALKLKTNITPRSFKINPTADPETQFRDWEDAASGPGDVLHLHGLLRPRKPVKSGIVLTESHFLKYGPRVRELLSSRLETDLLVFLGVSLTDANLVGPLFDTPAGKIKHRPFLVLVPHHAEPADAAATVRDQIHFFLQKTKSVAKSLRIRPIVLKSHSQSAQLLVELRTAIADLTQYEANGRYGERFKAVINKCYHAIGATDGRSFLETREAIALSDRLEQLLDPGHPVGAIVRRRLDRDALEGLPDEHIAVFLWLRSRKQGAAMTPYSIQVMGSSSYVVREPWSLVDKQTITNSSRFATVEATFHGQVTLKNVRAEQDWSTWKGNLAVPIRLAVDGALFTVGAMSLSTTLPVTDDRDASHPYAGLSFLRRLVEDDEAGDLTRELETAAIELLTS